MAGSAVYQTIAYCFLFCCLISIPADSTTPAGNDAYIGVLLPITGPDMSQALQTLTLGVDQINAGGGINGRPVHLVLRDTAAGDLEIYAKELARDPRIQVVIGPYTSDNLFQIADLFITNKKVLISPTASSDEIFRAFSQTGSVWRTITNDAEITSVMLQHLKAHQAGKIALLTPNSSYGRTFSDWIPFWAIENGMVITGQEQFSSQIDIPGAVRNLTGTDPDYLIFIHSGINEEIKTVLQTMEEENISTPLYLMYPQINEAGEMKERMNTGSLIGSVMSGQWKLQNSSASFLSLPDNTLLLKAGKTDSAFITEFKRKTGETPGGYDPQTYDALLVSAAIMSRFQTYPDKSPENAARSILLNQTGDPLPRSIQGFQEAFTRIRNGGAPVMTGATGPLTFDPQGTDRNEPWYGTYDVRDGKVVDDPLVYQDLIKSLGESNTTISSNRSSKRAASQSFGEVWAVIGALSQDWMNYRHQADALTMYRYVRDQGVPEDHIILMIYDDITNHKQNKKPGEVYHYPDIYEVRKGVHPAYTGETVNKQTLQQVLTGTEAPGEGPQLRSDEHATVLLYLSSHGTQGGILKVGNEQEEISPAEFSSLIDTMAAEKKFGNMLVILESCFSGATVADVHTPDVTLLAASAPDETSKASTYDSELAVWLSDECTSQLVSLLGSAGSQSTLSDLYPRLYHLVRSSHPVMKVSDPAVLDIPVSFFFGGGNNESESRTTESRISEGTA